MSSLMKVSPEDKKNARKAGFKKKAPKKPKSKTYDSMTGFISRYNGWAKELKAAASKGKKIEGLKKTINGL